MVRCWTFGKAFGLLHGRGWVGADRSTRGRVLVGSRIWAGARPSPRRRRTRARLGVAATRRSGQLWKMAIRPDDFAGIDLPLEPASEGLWGRTRRLASVVGRMLGERAETCSGSRIHVRVSAPWNGRRREGDALRVASVRRAWCPPASRRPAASRQSRRRSRSGRTSGQEVAPLDEWDAPLEDEPAHVPHAHAEVLGHGLDVDQVRSAPCRVRGPR